jgi:hypothetical protein
MQTVTLVALGNTGGNGSWSSGGVWSSNDNGGSTDAKSGAVNVVQLLFSQLVRLQSQQMVRVLLLLAADLTVSIEGLTLQEGDITIAEWQCVRLAFSDGFSTFNVADGSTLSVNEPVLDYQGTGVLTTTG